MLITKLSATVRVHLGSSSEKKYFIHKKKNLYSLGLYF
jgi:hypothetical protein